MSTDQFQTIWIINQYASTPETGMGGRHYYLAKELAKQGHKVYLIAASHTHLLRQPPKINNEFKIEDTDGFKFVWLKMPHYSGAHDKKRVLNWFRFVWKLLKLPNVIDDKPDSILASSPSPFVFLGSQRLAKKFNAKLAFEVRDIWPLTLVEIGGYSPKHPFIRLMQWVEDKAYRESDVVLSNLPKAVDHMVGRGMNADKFHWIPNGFDQQEVSESLPLTSDLLVKLPKNKFLVGYTGTLGVANALDVLIKAAEILRQDDTIAFVLVGGGKEKLSLIRMVEDLGLENVVFIDPIRKKQVQSMLAKMDVCFIGWKNEAIYRFSIAPNKIPEYMMSSKPIIHAYSGKFDYVHEANAGVSILAENPQAIANAVLKLKAMTPEQRNELGQNGRNYAIANHDYAKLSQKLAEVLS